MPSPEIIKAVTQLLSNNVPELESIFDYLPTVLTEEVTPAVILWELNSDEVQTAGGNIVASRGYAPLGLKDNTIKLDTHLVCFMANSSDSANVFRSILEKIKQVYRQQINLSGLADNQSPDVVSQILVFGEHMQTSIAPPVPNKSRVSFNAHVICDVREMLNA